MSSVQAASPAEQKGKELPRDSALGTRDARRDDRLDNHRQGDRSARLRAITVPARARAQLKSESPGSRRDRSLVHARNVRSARRTLEIEAPITDLILVVAMAPVEAVVPIYPGGIGVREAALLAYSPFEHSRRERHCVVAHGLAVSVCLAGPND